MLEQLQWLRPWWFLALIPLLAVVLWWLRSRTRANAWARFVDPELVEHVLEQPPTGRHNWPLWVAALAGLASILVLAGPVWERREMPVFRGQDALVLVLDLSQSMTADDIKPTRLIQAKYKISDLLQKSAGMQVGLVVFSEVPYVISPLTDDVKTLEAFLPALDTAVVPVQGSQLSLAIDKAAELLSQSSIAKGTIVLLTDARVDTAALEVATALPERGFRLSVLGIGTEEGQPIKLADGSFVQDQSGNIVIPRLERTGLQQLATSGGGVYTDISGTRNDVNTLFASVQLSATTGDLSEQAHESDQWVEYAPRVLPLLLLVMLPLFRRGLL